LDYKRISDENHLNIVNVQKKEEKESSKEKKETVYKNDETNTLSKESTNNIKNDKRDELTSEYNSENNRSERIKKEKTKEKKKETKEQSPYGYVYLATNSKNDKVFVGQTVGSRWKEDRNPIQERWKEHIYDAKKLKRKRKSNPNQKIRGLHLDNAINKYGFEVFELKQIDIACNQVELDEKETQWIKEYDSMNPEKGYNMTEGGYGGRLRPEIIEELSSIMKNNWKNQEYVIKQREARTDPEYIEKERKGAKKNWKDPNFIKKQRETRATPEFKEKISRNSKINWKDPNFIKKQKF